MYTSMMRAEVRNFSGIEILVKKLEAEDTEAYQEMMRINYETFWEIPMPILVIMLYAILV